MSDEAKVLMRERDAALASLTQAREALRAAYAKGYARGSAEASGADETPYMGADHTEEDLAALSSPAPKEHPFITTQNNGTCAPRMLTVEQAKEVALRFRWRGKLLSDIIEEVLNGR